MQSINVGGGYGTGREVVEFFLQYGPLAGLISLMLPAMLVISIVSMATFELARITKTYDYGSFLKILLGRFWFLYEFFYLVSVLLVIAVLGAAAGSLLGDNFGIPPILTTIVLMVAIAFLVFKGSQVLAGVLSFWSLVLYTVYITAFALSMKHFGPLVSEQLANSRFGGGWLSNGIRWAALQCALLPVALFTLSHHVTRKHALISGALVGPLYLVPAILFMFAMIPHYPDIVGAAIPLNYVMQQIGSPVLLIAFQIVLFGTFIETGAGLVHGFNERLAATLKAVGKDLQDAWRPIVALTVLFVAMVLSRFGIIDLVAEGYGTLTWFAIAVFVIPVLTIGIRKISRQQPDP